MKHGGVIIAEGSLEQGLKFIGPFSTTAAATAYAISHCDGSFELIILELPRGDEETSAG